MLKFAIQSKLTDGMTAAIALQMIRLSAMEATTIRLKKGSKEINVRSVLSTLTFGVEYDEFIEVFIEGNSEEKVAEEITSLLEGDVLEIPVPVN